MVQISSRSSLDPDSETDDEGVIPALGPNPAIRQAWDRYEGRELRWWVVVMLGAFFLSLVAWWAAR